MKSVGVDLHKKTITVCVMNQALQALEVRRFYCDETDRIVGWFKLLGACQVVVEATASYEWFVRLVEPIVSRVVLAHPKKLRVIAESTRKSDKLDARVLAEFLARDMLPESYRPTPRQQDHRRLVRHRAWVQKRITGAKNRVHRLLADYNTDIPGRFTRIEEEWLAKVPLSDVDRFGLARRLRPEGEQPLSLGLRLRGCAASGTPGPASAPIRPHRSTDAEGEGDVLRKTARTKSAPAGLTTRSS